MTKKLEELVNNLEACNGVFDYLIEPNDAELLVSYIKELQQKIETLKMLRSTCAFCPYYTENKELKEKYLNAVADYEETKSECQELHNKIDKAIELLKEHFVEEYIRSCDTSDGVGKYEIDTEHWTYKVYEQLKDSDVDE